MSNPKLKAWIDKCMDYHKKHPELTYKECLEKLADPKKAKTRKLAKTKKKKHGGNPLAIAGVTEAVKAIPGTVNALGDQIDKGRRTTHEINKENGNLSIEKAKKFNEYYRHLEHIRFWDGSQLPPNLRLERYKTNNSKFADEQKQKDEALYEYAKQQYGSGRRKKHSK